MKDNTKRNTLFLELYNKGYKDIEISKELKLTPSTIGRIRKSLNLEPRLLIHKYKGDLLKYNNLQNTEIAKKLNISITMVRSLRKELNLVSPSKHSIYNTQEDKIKGKMLVRSRSRAKKLNLDFNLALEDLILNEYCPLLNIKLDYLYKEQNNPNAASLDRIDSTKGYIKGNVMIISVLANTMKNNATLEQLDLFIKNLKPIINNKLLIQQ